jgi:hypothetical protein
VLSARCIIHRATPVRLSPHEIFGEASRMLHKIIAIPVGTGLGEFCNSFRGCNRSHTRIKLHRGFYSSQAWK